MRVASKVVNLASKFGHARPLGFRIIRYVRDGRTDRRTDGQKRCLLSPGGRIIISVESMLGIEDMFSRFHIQCMNVSNSQTDGRTDIVPYRNVCVYT